MNQDRQYEPVGDVIRDDVPHDLLVRLTELERLAIAEHKATAETELENRLKRRTEMLREFDVGTRDLERRIAEMGAELRDRHQRQVVLCYERWADGRIEVVRKDMDPRDPAAVIDRRAATTEEAQRALLGTEAGPSNVVAIEAAAGKRKRR